jgi:malonate decarboxylase delta subunit
MEDLTFRHETRHRAIGSRQIALIGVVASGNLEVLAERVLSGADCLLEIKTAAHGFADVWKAVVDDFVDRHSPGGIRFSINDGGARPDMVSLRLAQAARLMQEDGK